jgi:hypothetical protein
MKRPQLADVINIVEGNKFGNILAARQFKILGRFFYTRYLPLTMSDFCRSVVNPIGPRYPVIVLVIEIDILASVINPIWSYSDNFLG